MTLERLLPGIVLATLVLGVSTASADVSYTFKRLGGYSEIDLTFSFQKSEEKRILNEIGPVAQGGHVLLWFLACSRTVALYKPFLIRQGSLVASPVLCVDRTYFCDPTTPEKGNVYRGYLYLEKGFDLRKPLQITLGNTTLKGVFDPKGEP